MSTSRDDGAVSRGWCWALVALGGVVFAVLAVALVPWDWVPGGRVAEIAPRQVFTARQIARGETYSALQRHLGWASLAVSLVLGLLLGLTSWGARLTARLPGPWWLRVLSSVLALLVLGELATLPISLAQRGHALDYGLTGQPLSGWVRDQAASLLVAWAVTGVAALLVVGSARLSPRRWPVWTALVGVVLTVSGSWVYPVVVEPLFNSFTSLPPGRLRTEVLALARRERVRIDDVLVADASRRTTTLNAYVTGLGSTRRVVLYDNLVRDVPRRQVLSVVGHELGHARDHDVATGTALGASGVVVASGLLGLLLDRRRLLARLAVAGAGAPEVVPLLLALSAVVSLAVSPLENTISRAVEARADRSTLQATGDYTAFEEVQRRLALRSLSDPTPPGWSQFWFGTHPTTLQRWGIAAALRSGRARE